MEGKQLMDLFSVQLEFDNDNMELGYLITYNVGVASVLDDTGMRQYMDEAIRNLADEILVKMQEQAENAKAEGENE